MRRNGLAEGIELEVQVAVAKIGKYASSESGDTVEMIERPHGGLSLVMADGQRSGHSAKAISNVVVRKAISLLGEGVRDGAAARATQDYLYTYRRGKVQATLNIVSIDLQTKTIVLSRNSNCPVVVVTPAGIQILDESSKPIGVYRGVKPVISELPIAVGTYVLMFTDGIATAGTWSPHGLFDVPKFVADLLDAHSEKPSNAGTPSTAGDVSPERQHAPGAQMLADAVLYRALELDSGRPRDDMTVVVVAILPRKVDDQMRRMTVRYPIPEIVS
jgi:serine phosphatase RsbU (regulator of sigma subunit)